MIPPTQRELHLTFDDLLAVATMMSDFPATWYIAGGWAIDLFTGEALRHHADIEIGIARSDQAAIHAHFPDWTKWKMVEEAGEGTLQLWEEGDWLELPVHQILLAREHTRPPEFEFFLNTVQDGIWYFRRDARIHRPVEEVSLLSSSGIPIIAPEIQLLYKAKGHREKDYRDFLAALPYMDEERRTWLRNALQLLYPDDLWLGKL